MKIEPNAKKQAEAGHKATKNGADTGKQGGKGKGSAKTDLQDELFSPASPAFHFYRSSDADLMETEENANTDEQDNPKKRKDQPVADTNSSDDEFVPPQIEDPVPISNLINNANEATLRPGS